MDQKQLNKILDNHKLWLESKGKKGAQANLYDANLEGANLVDANLTGANLIGAKFTYEIREARYLKFCSITKDQLPWLALHPDFSEFYPTLAVS